MKILALFKKRKFWKWLLFITIVLPVLLLTLGVAILYWKQDAIVQHLLTNLNKDFKGSISLKDSHISMFSDFPYISIDLEEVKIYESKEATSEPIASLKDVYLGFDLWTVLSGQMEIKKIHLKQGFIHLVMNDQGEMNISKALSSTKTSDTTAGDKFHLNIKKIELENIDLNKYNVSSKLLLDTYIQKALASFKTNSDTLTATLDAAFELNVVQDKDTTFIKHKHFEVNTEISYQSAGQILSMRPTVMRLEGAEFNVAGNIDFLNEAYLDFTFSGSKPNFDLFIAMAPEELIPTLKKYDNKGKIYFNARVKGKSLNGQIPEIRADFGCEQAYFNNTTSHKKLDQLFFKGYFSNGTQHDLSSMEFGLYDFSAKPEAGTFTGNLLVKNFAAPEIDLKLKSDFELDFLAKFLNLEDLQNLKGKVLLTMNFKDIIDPEFPEKSIEKLNESYFTEVKIENLSFKSPHYPLPIHDLDLYAELNGHKAQIRYANLVLGKSDLSLSGSISDLPAILHHTGESVLTQLNIKSKFLDIYELTGSDSIRSVNEQIENLSLNLAFTSSAKSITESPNLPIGEFFIENLYAKLKHYPHVLHDFHADVYVDKEDFRIIDFKGMIDKSDFLFTGKLKHYEMWFAQEPLGDTRMEFYLKSKLLQLEDLFAYQGENYVPSDYRHEEFRNLTLHGFTDLHFKNGLRSVDLYLDQFDAGMKVHPLRFNKFNGRIHYEDEHLVVENFSGSIGKSDFKTTLHYYLGKDESVKKRDNHFELISQRLDFDELFNYSPPPSSSTQQVNHDAGFNIYELPFTTMTFDINIGHLNYHKYLIHNFKGKIRSTPNHYIYLDQMHLEAAGGHMDIQGYFNGSNPKLIYFSPVMKLKNIDLDKLLFKFDNFGQDYIVSENLHGKLTGTITGKIHMHTDLIPKIDDSEIHLDMEVVQGRLENYAMFDYMSDYFKDKNLKKVMFDTLTNHLDLTKGVLTIPNMRVNSSLGFMEIAGKQNLNLDMEYYLRIPWKMVTSAASSKLFGKRPEEVNPDQVDAIQYADPEKRIRFVNIKISGTPDNYKISLGRQKS